MKLVMEEQKVYQIWIDVKKKVASFKEVDAGELVEFYDYEMYDKYLLGLMSQWYFFQ